jgi:predicted TIM-barrel fold metal-dependent hydrolase
MTKTLASLKGKIMDSLSYDYLPYANYGKVFGPAGDRYFEVLKEQFTFWRTVYDSDAIPTDVLDIEPEKIWNQKGPLAPSAIDLTRRPAVLDALGIRRQILTPALLVHALPVSTGLTLLQPPIPKEGMAAAVDLIDAYNEWVANYTKKYGDRVIIPGAAPSTNITPDEFAKRAEKLIKMGIKMIAIPNRTPPLGMSPGDPALDPFYSTLAAANVPLLLRGGSQSTGWRHSEVWGRVPESVLGPNFPYLGKDVSFVNAFHQGEETFLTTMVLGGVFERHPKLRMGMLKVGAGWLGPLAERLDRGLPPFYEPTYLPMKPSEYINRNVRVTPWGDGGDARHHHPRVKGSTEGGDNNSYEPVELYFQRYPQIQDCFCYASDYPLDEGGKDNLRKWYERVAPLGDDIIEKYFIKNVELLMP